MPCEIKAQTQAYPLNGRLKMRRTHEPSAALQLVLTAGALLLSDVARADQLCGRSFDTLTQLHTDVSTVRHAGRTVMQFATHVVVQESGKMWVFAKEFLSGLASCSLPSVEFRLATKSTIKFKAGARALRPPVMHLSPSSAPLIGAVPFHNDRHAVFQGWIAASSLLPRSLVQYVFRDRQRLRHDSKRSSVGRTSGMGHERQNWKRAQRFRCNPQQPTLERTSISAASGHVWTAPGWQGKSSRRRLGRCSHVFGLLVRFT